MAQAAAAVGSKLAYTGLGIAALVVFNQSDGLRDYTKELSKMTMHFIMRPGPGEYGYNNNSSMLGGGGGNIPPPTINFLPLTDQIEQLTREVARLRTEQQFNIRNPHFPLPVPSIPTVIIILTASGAVLYIAGVRSLADILPVTKKHFNTTIGAVREGVQGLANALTKVRQELLERIGVVEQKVDASRLVLEGKLDGVRKDVLGVARSQNALEDLMRGIEGKMLTAEEQLNQANRGILLLCAVVADTGVNNQDLHEFTRRYASMPAMGRSRSLPSSSSSLLNSKTLPELLLTNQSENGSVPFLIGNQNESFLREGLQQLLDISTSSRSSFTNKKNPNIPVAKEIYPTASVQQQEQ